jgi:hypothetical protein
MFEEIHIKYIHPVFNIGVENIRSVWLLSATPSKLTNTVHQGNLIFRVPLTGKRISYKTLKKGLIKKQLIIRLPYSLLPF